jgi:hypothetical protein
MYPLVCVLCFLQGSHTFYIVQVSFYTMRLKLKVAGFRKEKFLLVDCQ